MEYPRTKEELIKLVKSDCNLADIETYFISDMRELFRGTERTDFSGIETWDTSNVENMGGMFYKVKCFNENIGGWDVSKVKDMN